MASQKQAYDAWKAGLTPSGMGAEPRFQFDIKIMGSPDWLYPVWWVFPGNEFPEGKISISRPYYWDGGGGTAHQKLRNVSEGHIAALLLTLEGNACPWSGDANYMKVLRFSERYNNTASHLGYGIPCKAKQIETSKTLDYAPENSSIHSGVYLRGGGLTYRITSNFTGAQGVNYLDGSKGTDEQKEIYRHLNGLVYVQPKPFSELKSPVVG